MSHQRLIVLAVALLTVGAPNSLLAQPSWQDFRDEHQKLLSPVDHRVPFFTGQPNAERIAFERRLLGTPRFERRAFLLREAIAAQALPPGKENDLPRLWVFAALKTTSVTARDRVDLRFPTLGGPTIEFEVLRARWLLQSSPGGGDPGEHRAFGHRLLAYDPGDVSMVAEMALLESAPLEKSAFDRARELLSRLRARLGAASETVLSVEAAIWYEDARVRSKTLDSAKRAEQAFDRLEEIQGPVPKGAHDSSFQYRKDMLYWRNKIAKRFGLPLRSPLVKDAVIEMGPTRFPAPFAPWM